MPKPRTPDLYDAATLEGDVITRLTDLKSEWNNPANSRKIHRVVWDRIDDILDGSLNAALGGSAGDRFHRFDSHLNTYDAHILHAVAEGRMAPIDAIEEFADTYPPDTPEFIAPIEEEETLDLARAHPEEPREFLFEFLQNSDSLTEIDPGSGEKKLHAHIDISHPLYRIATRLLNARGKMLAGTDDGIEFRQELAHLAHAVFYYAYAMDSSMVGLAGDERRAAKLRIATESVLPLLQFQFEALQRKRHAEFPPARRRGWFGRALEWYGTHTSPNARRLIGVGIAAGIGGIVASGLGLGAIIPAMAFRGSRALIASLIGGAVQEFVRAHTQREFDQRRNQAIAQTRGRIESYIDGQDYEDELLSQANALEVEAQNLESQPTNFWGIFGDNRRREHRVRALREQATKLHDQAAHLPNTQNLDLEDEDVGRELMNGIVDEAMRLQKELNDIGMKQDRQHLMRAILAGVLTGGIVLGASSVADAVSHLGVQNGLEIKPTPPADEVKQVPEVQKADGRVPDTQSVRPQAQPLDSLRLPSADLSIADQMRGVSSAVGLPDSLSGEPPAKAPDAVPDAVQPETAVPAPLKSMSAHDIAHKAHDVITHAEKIHEIEKGDNLWKVAKREFGLSDREVANALRRSYALDEYGHEVRMDKYHWIQPGMKFGIFEDVHGNKQFVLDVSTSKGGHFGAVDNPNFKHIETAQQRGVNHLESVNRTPSADPRITPVAPRLKQLESDIHIKGASLDSPKLDQMGWQTWPQGDFHFEELPPDQVQHIPQGSGTQGVPPSTPSSAAPSGSGGETSLENTQNTQGSLRPLPQAYQHLGPLLKSDATINQYFDYVHNKPVSPHLKSIFDAAPVEEKSRLTSFINTNISHDPTINRNASIRDQFFKGIDLNPSS